MSVVQKVIFCEGKESSFDSQLLLRLKPNDVAVVGAGGKFSFTPFLEGYFSKSVQDPNVQRNQKYIIFRDRDFDIEPPQQVELLQISPQSQIFLSYRTCIENYFLDPQLIDQYWNDKYKEKLENPSSKWGHKDSPGIEAMSQWIENASRNLKDYQAVRWALADLVRINSSQSDVKTTWTGNSGILPQSITLQDCRSEALKLVEQFRTGVSRITASRFEEQLMLYTGKFEQEVFWSQQQYMVWFHGKDIQKQMQRERSQYISLKDFFKWAVERVDIAKHADLFALKQQVELL